MKQKTVLRMSTWAIPMIMVFVAHELAAQSGANLDDIMVTDLHGDLRPLSTIAVQRGLERGGGNSVVAGFFNLVFSDEPGVGFNHADGDLGQQLRDIAVKVFTDLSVLVEPALDPHEATPTYPLVQMQIYTDDPLNPFLPGQLGLGTSYLSVTQTTLTPIRSGVV